VTAGTVFPEPPVEFDTVPNPEPAGGPLIVGADIRGLDQTPNHDNAIKQTAAIPANNTTTITRRRIEAAGGGVW
jgi:hypothetical protein